MVVSTVPAGLAEGSFVAVFRHVLYDTAFFCYPLPQFAGVNSHALSSVLDLREC